MKGHLGFTIRPRPFVPFAVVLQTDTAWGYFAVPDRAKTMKAWAVGAGGKLVENVALGAGSGGVAFKTWNVTPGSTVAFLTSYTPYGYAGARGDAKITYGLQTIVGHKGVANDGVSFPDNDGSFSGSYDGGSYGQYGYASINGIEGGALNNAAGADQTTLRTPAADVSGLLAAAELAGEKVIEDDGVNAAFGSGGFYSDDYGGTGIVLDPGYGGGGGGGQNLVTGEACVVLYFT